MGKARYNYLYDFPDTNMQSTANLTITGITYILLRKLCWA